ncbi:beta/gamma crystallin-related protein [Methylocapsa palsarum]|nr:beta/gamma crystallin-related protein [Methylocapsa palsarum]
MSVLLDKRGVVAIGALLLTVLFSPAAYAACNPGADQAAFFKDANFGGSCSVRGVGNYPNANAIGLPNDSISSVKLGANVQVVLCKDVNFGGDCILLKASESFVHDNRVGNDNTTSLRVQPLGFAECIPNANQVSFYTNADFLGSCVVKEIGDYTNSGAIGLRDNSISAIHVGANVQVVVCKDIGFQGDCILVTADVPFVNDSRVGNDQISSAKVQARGTSECQPAENQASFFTNADFLGNCVVKNIGDYPTSEAIGLPNDSISSVRIGGKAQVEICTDAQFKGDCILLTSDVRFLSGDRVPNDSITALKVQPRGARDCVPRANQASFFMHADFLAPCVSLGVGDYNDHTHIGLDDKSISSLELGPGAQACICTGENFGTMCSKYTSDSPLIAENDLVSSLKVQTPGALCQAVAAPPPKGYSQLAVFNCQTEKRTVHYWTRDLTSGAPFKEEGSSPAQYDASGSCPAAASPFIIKLTNGHQIEFVAVDPGSTICGGVNDPQTGGCVVSPFTQPFLGDANGPSLTLPSID